MNTTQIIPTRSARRQFHVAAANSVLIERAQNPDFYLVDGVGGPCYMQAAEYEQYKKLCAAWAEAGSDQHDALGSLVMGATEADASFAKATEHEWAELTRRPRSYFRDSFREIEQLLLSYNHSLSEEDRDEMMLTLCAKILPLREAVLRAEEIWEDESFANALASEKRRAQA